MRANQTFAELTGTASEVADEILATEYEELDYMTTAEWQEQVGPGQYFVTGSPVEKESEDESTSILWERNRVYPALMKNVEQHDLEGVVVDPDLVEVLGLERLEKDELKEWVGNILTFSNWT